jgi:hypothetical protein
MRGPILGTVQVPAAPGVGHLLDRSCTSHWDDWIGHQLQPSEWASWHSSKNKGDWSNTGLKGDLWWGEGDPVHG